MPLDTVIVLAFVGAAFGLFVASLTYADMTWDR
jgi:hypothetical protein